MNSCDYYQELISSLIDGEISHDEHEALMAHLNTCSRCNAMYAVFHDLSDILAEEIEPLPEGLHENIMAGVRRSEIIRKNRRLRKLGLRTALTAAACAVLVLFAARGVTPAERANSVSIRSEEEVRQTIPTPSPDSLMPAATPAPAQAEYAAPVQTYAPAPVST
jgi:anti-sigma factor RsiW